MHLSAQVQSLREAVHRGVRRPFSLPLMLISTVYWPTISAKKTIKKKMTKKMMKKMKMKVRRPFSLPLREGFKTPSHGKCP